MYNYLREMKEDVKNYLEENAREYEGLGRRTIEERLYKNLWIEDSVTGNASGSYTFNTCEAQEYVGDNLDLLQEAVTEFGYNWEEFNPLAKGFEWCDVTIRCYLLGQAINEALNEVEK